MTIALLQKESQEFYWKKRDPTAILSPKEERELFQKLEMDPKNKAIRDEIIQRNRRLVKSLAREMKNRLTAGLEFEDIYQEGVMGLMHAVKRFDWKKGYKFSTYATPWIRQAIARAIIIKGRTIKIPFQAMETISKYKRVKRKLFQNLKRPPLAKEIATEMGIEVEKVYRIEETQRTMVSLERPIKGVNDDTIREKDNDRLIDFIEDEKAISPGDEAEKEDLKNKIKQILSSYLFPREGKILTLRFGLLNDGREYTLETIGNDLGLTKERIRQLQKKSIKKLAENPLVRKLSEEFKR